MRIAGVNIPDNKRVQIALTYIYGIGKATATKICEQAEVSIDTKRKVRGFGRSSRMRTGLRVTSAKKYN